jgi:LmbE family N-acetylglucosaminyl deacetylase
MTPLPVDSVPVRLPQYRLRDGGLYFLISRRPIAVLDACEQEVWESLDGSARVRDVAARFPAGAGEAALRRFVELGVCLPVAASFPEGRRRILLIEPHMDDGALSLGGTMWSRRAQCEFTIVSLAGRCNFTSYYNLERDYFDVDEVSALRRAESVLLARAVGGRHVALDLPEAPLRYRPGRWTLDWFRRHHASISAFIGHTSSPGELRSWAGRIRQVLQEHPADEVWAPIGVGPHTDHELVRNAFLTILLEDPGLLSRCEVRFYQEVPYAAQFPRFTAAIVEELTRSGARLELETVPVTETFPDKLRLISIFGSQFKLEVLRPGIEAAARAAAGDGGGMAEVLYRVVAPPKRLDFVALSVGAPEVRRLAEELGPWIERHRRTGRIRLFMRPPAGRWVEDMQLLSDTFPVARFAVRASREALAEATDARSPRIEVRPIGKGAAAWVLGVLSANLEGPAPTLIIAFADRMREARRLSALLPLSDTLVVPSMNHLALALRLLAGAGGPPGVSGASNGSAGS